MKFASCRNDVASDAITAVSSSASACGFGLLLNISSIRSVTRKPPTTLIVPKTIAITSRILLSAAVDARGRAR